jgi:hypothetical protein
MDARLMSPVALLGLWLVVLALAVWPAGAEAVAGDGMAHHAAGMAMADDGGCLPAVGSDGCVMSCCAALVFVLPEAIAKSVIHADVSPQATPADGLRPAPPHGPPKSHA